MAAVHEMETEPGEEVGVGGGQIIWDLLVKGWQTFSVKDKIINAVRSVDHNT